MASPRPTQSQIAAARKAARQEEMDRAIATGSLVVRQMTPEEREQSAAHLAAAQARNKRRARPGPR
jgi:hypothetical protein